VKIALQLFFVFVNCAFYVILLPAQAEQVTLGKKGIAMGSTFDIDGSRLSRLHVNWYYNWTTKPNSPRTENCFVPMYWGKRGSLDELLKATNPYPVLLTFNEPDFERQSNRQVFEVIDEWPVLENLAHRLSTPTAGRPFEPWFRDFMSKANSKGLRRDFMPVHWYGGADSGRFLQFLDNLHQLYGLPIWITEFAVADWHSTKHGEANRFTENDVIKFMKEVLPRLEQLDYIERYAWLAAKTDKESLRSSMLFTDDGKLTKVGITYSEFGYLKDVFNYCGAN